MSSYRRLLTCRVVVQQTIVSSIKKSLFTFSKPRALPCARGYASAAQTAACSLAHTAPSVRLVDSAGVNVEWTEREEDYFHGVWLRHNCHCPLCIDEDSNQKIVDIAHLDDPAVTHAAVNGENWPLFAGRLSIRDYKRPEFTRSRLIYTVGGRYFK